MRQLEIVKYPDPVLQKKAAPVNRVTPEICEFVERMAQAMHDYDGVGLAAPQVGISLRIIVVDTGDGVVPLINPVIVSQEGMQRGVEGCLSLPGLYGEVTRAERVTVSGMNVRGKKITRTGEGMWARAMQHEIDHLDGILFTDRIHEDTLHWITGEQDEDGHYIERSTSLADALRIFEEQYSISAA